MSNDVRSNYRHASTYGTRRELRVDGESSAMPVVEDMSEQLARREVDHVGTIADGSLPFGLRRLAIIELSPSGGQPIIYAGLPRALVFSGTIYTYRKLCTQLVARSSSVFSNGDSEVIIELHQAWVDQGAQRFYGLNHAMLPVVIMLGLTRAPAGNEGTVLLAHLNAHRPETVPGVFRSSNGMTCKDTFLNCASRHKTTALQVQVFGNDFATCHRTTIWSIAEYRHPPREFHCVRQVPPRAAQLLQNAFPYDVALGSGLPKRGTRAVLSLPSDHLIERHSWNGYV